MFDINTDINLINSRIVYLWTSIQERINVLKSKNTEYAHDMLLHTAEELATLEKKLKKGKF